MGFLRRTFSRRSKRRFRTSDELDGTGRGGNAVLQAHQQQVIHAPTVVTGGAVVHIPAAGNSKDAITCRVLLLDGSDVNVELPVSVWGTSVAFRERKVTLIVLNVVFNGKVLLCVCGRTDFPGVGSCPGS